MKFKNLYEIRGASVRSNFLDNKTVDYYTGLADAIAKVNGQNTDFPNATSRDQIVDSLGLKFLVTNPYEKCDCPLVCPACFASKSFVGMAVPKRSDVKVDTEKPENVFSGPVVKPYSEPKKRQMPEEVEVENTDVPILDRSIGQQNVEQLNYPIPKQEPIPNVVLPDVLPDVAAETSQKKQQIINVLLDIFDRSADEFQQIITNTWFSANKNQEFQDIRTLIENVDFNDLPGLSKQAKNNVASFYKSYNEVFRETPNLQIPVETLEEPPKKITAKERLKEAKGYEQTRKQKQIERGLSQQELRKEKYLEIRKSEIAFEQLKNEYLQFLDQNPMNFQRALEKLSNDKIISMYNFLNANTKESALSPVQLVNANLLYDYLQHPRFKEDQEKTEQRNARVDNLLNSVFSLPDARFNDYLNNLEPQDVIELVDLFKEAEVSPSAMTGQIKRNWIRLVYSANQYKFKIKQQQEQLKEQQEQLLATAEPNVIEDDIDFDGLGFKKQSIPTWKKILKGSKAAGNNSRRIKLLLTKNYK